MSRFGKAVATSNGQEEQKKKKEIARLRLFIKYQIYYFYNVKPRRLSHYHLWPIHGIIDEAYNTVAQLGLGLPDHAQYCFR